MENNQFKWHHQLDVTRKVLKIFFKFFLFEFQPSNHEVNDIVQKKFY